MAAHVNDKHTTASCEMFTDSLLGLLMLQLQKCRLWNCSHKSSTCHKRSQCVQHLENHATLEIVGEGCRTWNRPMYVYSQMTRDQDIGIHHQRGHLGTERTPDFAYDSLLTAYSLKQPVILHTNSNITSARKCPKSTKNIGLVAGDGSLLLPL